MAMLKNVLAKLKAVHYDCQERSVYNLTNLSIRKLHTYMNSNDAAKLCAFTATYFTWQTCAWAAFGLLRKVCSLPYESLRGCFFPRISMSCGIWTTLVLNGSGYAILNWCLKKNLTIVQSNWKYSSRFREILQEILWEILRDPSRHPLGYGSPASILVAHVEASAEALLRPWQSGSSDHFHMASAKWGGTKAALSAKFN